ncbi:MAG: TraB/GumN family protein [Bacteroidetes bacterium]|nr:TraB/GumN family protein [Bacteroidota bacterium]
MNKKSIYLALFIGMVGLVQAQSKNMKKDQGVLWQVSGNGLTKPSYIYGTFHLGIKPADSLVKTCVKLIKKSSIFFGEIDLYENNQDVQKMSLMGTLPNQGKLSELYTPEEYILVKKYMHDSLHLEEAMYEHFKPMMVSMMISMMSLTKLEGMDDINYSIDKEFQNIAIDNHVKVQGLETVEIQSDIMFNQISLKDQAKYLLQSIETEQFSKDSIQTMIKYYYEGNLFELNKMINQSMNKNFINIFLNQRNKNWLAIILPLLKKQESIFIAVGAGHLTGSSGLIQLLRKEGYTVNPIN